MTSPTKKQSGFSLEGATFYIALLILFSVIGIFFYFQYLINKSNQELADISVQAAKTKTEEQKKLEDRVSQTVQKLDFFSQKFKSRKSNVEFFNQLEKLIIPEVYFTNCTLNSDGLSASFSGYADSFKALDQQIAILRSANDVISGAVLSRTSIDSHGGIDFALNISISPAMVAFK